MGYPMRVTESALATTPAAAGVALLLARTLPIQFSFQPNDLGIYSPTILARYPAQQETFWFVFAIAMTAFLAWLAQRVLRRRVVSARQTVALEALGIAVLLAAVGLPAFSGLLAVGALLAAAAFLVLRAPLEPRSEAPGLAVPDAAGIAVGPGFNRRTGALWCAVILVVASVFSADPYAESGLFEGVAHVVHGSSDRELMVDSPEFKIERGQHLLWADALRNGELPGRDFFSLYGPLYDLSLLGAWSVFGRSLASTAFFEGLIAFLGMAALLLLALRLVEHRWTIFVIPLLTPYVSLRIGLGFLGLFCLVQWLRHNDARWCAAAGMTAGFSLLFSQEYGLAFLAVSVVALSIGWQVRPALLLAAGLALALLPVAAWLARYGALEPMLADLVAYPSYLLAGYGNLPFPPLTAHLPQGPGPPSSFQDLVLRLAYVPPLILAGALLLALPLREFDLAAPWASLQRIRGWLRARPLRLAIVLVALYGLLCFRSALGRSDVWHFVAVLPPAALLLCVGLDRCVALWRNRERVPGATLRACWRTAALIFLVLQSGMPQATRPLDHLERSASELDNLFRGEQKPPGDPRGFALLQWLRGQLRPEDGIFFGPSNPAFYYLANRPNPTRFATPYLMVTDAHRAEALADLRAKPPRFIVWDEGIWRFDDLPLEIVLGDDLLRWIDTHYTPPTSRYGFSIRRYGAIETVPSKDDPGVPAP